MIQGMRAASDAGIKTLRVRGDSNLAIQQIQVRHMPNTNASLSRIALPGNLESEERQSPALLSTSTVMII